jgi:hypothetical protein
MLYHLLTSGTRVYTVHEGPMPPVDRMDRAEALAFVKDGFSLPAFVLGPVWLLAYQLWLAMLGYVLAALAIAAAHFWGGIPETIVGILFFGLHLLVGFEADSAARDELERKGWVTLGSVSGNSALECERRFFETWLPGQPVLALKGTDVRPPAPPVAQPEMRSMQTPSGSGVTAAADRTVAGRFAALLRGKK